MPNSCNYISDPFRDYGLPMGAVNGSSVAGTMPSNVFYSSSGGKTVGCLLVRSPQCVGPMRAQQLFGFNAVISYSTTMFVGAAVSHDAAVGVTIAVWLCFLISFHLGKK